VVVRSLYQFLLRVPHGAFRYDALWIGGDHDRKLGEILVTSQKESSAKSRDLILHLKGIFFDQIDSGEKTEEYRLYNPYWIKRLVNRSYDRILICRGYPKKNDVKEMMARPYHGYIIKTIQNDFFGKDPVTVFAIDVKGQRRDTPSISQ
jgi:hypothetical protein